LSLQSANPAIFQLALILVDDPIPDLTTPTLFLHCKCKITQVQMDLKKDFNLCNVRKKQLTHQLQQGALVQTVMKTAESESNPPKPKVR
jgi:hypothetical protein